MDRAGGQSRPGRGFPCVAEGKLSSPLQISGVRRAETPSIPIPYISLRIRRAPPPTKTFFVPYDEGNMAGPRRHCGGPRTGGRHLVPIRTGGVTVFNRKNNPNFRGERGGAIFDSESAIRRRIEPVTQPSGGGARVRPLGRFLSWGVLDWSPLGQGTIHAKGYPSG